MVKEIKDLSELQTFAQEFLSLFPKGGVFGLRGTLGAGKTTFVKACVLELCSKNAKPLPRVVSPSFVVHQHYDTQPPVDHFDFYRLELATAESLIDIGYWEAFDRAQTQGAYVFVEWPEKASEKSLRLTAELGFSLGSQENSRRVEIRRG